MVKIRNGHQIMLVPTSAYEKIYKPIGWVLVVPKTASSNTQKQPTPSIQQTESNKSSQALLEELENLVSVEELKIFAAEHDINVEGLTSRRIIKTAIKEAIEKS